MDKFIPVKITDKEWADKLLDGEVYMRSLYEFGSWNKNKNDKLNNQFRGDIREGTAAVYRDIEKTAFTKGLDPRVKKLIHELWFVDESDVKYFKIFSLYCMDYVPETNFFATPDPKIAEFGDTAVIIRDFNEFMERYAKALFKVYPHVVSLLDRVSFYSANENRETNPLFEKEASFEYQKELRMAFGILEPNPFARLPKDGEAWSIVMDTNSVKLQLGSIRDIAIALPIEEFLALKFPKDIRLRFPMREEGEAESNFDSVVKTTREQMKDYRSILTKPTFIIG